MEARFFVDKQESLSTTMQVPAFPWVRADAGRFVWEEALFEGNLLSVHRSALGRGQSKENVFTKLTGRRFPRPHLYAFELEVDGELLRDGWEWRGERLFETPEGFPRLVVELEHPAAPLTVEVHTLLDGTPFLVRWLGLRNHGERPLALSRVFPWCGLVAGEEEGTTILRRDGDRGFSLGRYRNQSWGMEGEWFWAPLPQGTLAVQTQGNKYHPPLLALRNDATGELVLLHVECTPDIEVTFTLGSEGGRGPGRPWGGEYVYARAGLGGPPPRRRLQPGEAAVTPAVHLGMVYGDLDAGVQALHEHLRASVMPPAPAGGAHLVEYNHTGYTLNAQISRQALGQEVEMAAAIGVELFLVDAGWFGPADKAWSQSVGDWTENPILGEGGLLAVFDEARRLGMKCGLWMPPEWVSPGVGVHQSHPEWFPRGTTFDLLDPAVAEHVYATICAAVERFRLDCYRIDGGSSDVGDGPSPAGGRENLSWRYYDVLYGIYERVRQRFPHLILENCSGGGGRSDLGMLRRLHYTQISDNWDPPCQVRILNGMTLGLAPEQCMPLVGSINPRVADIDFVIRTGMLGHFTASGVFPSLERANAPTLERWKHGVEVYKHHIRPWLSTSRVYHHTPEQDFRSSGEWVVLEYTSRIGDRGAVGLFRLADAPSDTFGFTSRGLDPSRDYRVIFDSSGRSVVLSGLALRTTGLPVRVPAPLMSELLIIQPQ